VSSKIVVCKYQKLASKMQNSMATKDGSNMDIQPPGMNLYFKYEFVPATPATAVGETRQPT
jgi:hypothetical protein